MVVFTRLARNLSHVLYILWQNSITSFESPSQMLWWYDQIECLWPYDESMHGCSLHSLWAAARTGSVVLEELKKLISLPLPDSLETLFMFSTYAKSHHLFWCHLTRCFGGSTKQIAFASDHIMRKCTIARGKFVSVWLFICWFICFN